MTDKQSLFYLEYSGFGNLWAFQDSVWIRDSGAEVDVRRRYPVDTSVHDPGYGSHYS